MVALSDYLELEATATDNFPGSPYSYTPGSGVQAVLVFVAARSPNYTAPTYGGNAMQRIESMAWVELGTLGSGRDSSVFEIYYYETNSEVAANIVVTGTTSASFVAAATLDATIQGITQYNFRMNPYLGTLPDAGAGVVTNVDVPHESDDLILCISHGIGPLFSNTTQVGVFNQEGATLAGAIYADNPGSSGTKTYGLTGQSTQRSRGGTAIKLTGTAVDRLHIDSHKQYEAMYKVDQNTQARTHTFSGKYWGSAPTAVQVRVLRESDDTTVVDWTTVDASPSLGSWSGTLSVPLGGPYYTEARYSNNTSVTCQQAQRFYIAISVLMYGQSNASLFSSGPGDIGVVYKNGVNTLDSTGKQFMGQASRLGWGLLDALYEEHGVPVMAYAYGQAGTPIAFLRDGNPPFLFVDAYLDNVGADFLLWQHGLADISIGTTEADYESHLSALHAEVVTHAGLTKADIPLIAGSPNRQTSPHAAAPTAAVRNAIYNYTKNETNAHYSHCSLDSKMADVAHMAAGSVDFTTDPGSNAMAGRYGQTLAKLLGLSPKDATFFIDAVDKVDNTTIDVFLAHNQGTDITPATGIAGFEVSDDNVTWAPATAVRLNASTIRLTHSSNAAEPMFVRYLWGSDPNGDEQSSVTTMVRDNSPYRNSLNFTFEGLLTSNGVPSFNKLFGLGSQHAADANLAGFWPLQDDAADNVIADISGNNQNGTLQGDTTNDLSIAGPNSWLPKAIDPGVFGFHLSRYIDLPLVVTGKPVWFAFWIYADNSFSNQTAISFSDSSVAAAQDSVIINHQNSSQIRMFFRNTTTQLINGPSVSPAGWRFVAGVLTNESSRDLYVDGDAALNSTVSTPAIAYDNIDVGRLGDSTPSDYLHEGIAGLAIFSRVPVGGELQLVRRGPELIYGSGATISEAGVFSIGSWQLPSPFDGGSNGSQTQEVIAVDAAGVILDSATTATGTLDLSANAGNTCYLLARVSNGVIATGHDIGDFGAGRVSSYGRSEDGYYELASVTAAGSSGPTVSSATINAAGTTLTLVFSEEVTTDYTGLAVTGYVLSNWAGSGTNTLTATITQVYSDETPALDYVSATGNLTGVTSGEELADLTDSAITNNSTVSPNPTVTTGAATSIGTATASVPGTVTSEGRESVTERGVVWNTSTGPTTANNKVMAGTGAGAFVASLTGLPDNTLIYFRAYATNASGTSYGAEDTFTTLDDPNPTINSIRFSDGGTRIRIAFSEAVTGTTGFSVDAGTITYVSGSGSAVYLFSFTGTPITVSYTPGNVVDSISQALGASGPTAIDPEPTSNGAFQFVIL